MSLPDREPEPASSDTPETSATPATSELPLVVSTITSLRARLDAERARGRTVGFVPTMGYFHDGHLSLMAAARAACDVVVVSHFVNPLQFAPSEDLATYPRDLARDLASAATVGVDLVFQPEVAEMYPTWPAATTVRVSGVSEGLESVTRPHFFEGVATVVAKLFAIVGPSVAYFGKKDYQQLAVVRRMADDLRLPVTVVGCPIVREPDGLAMSSRNVYLNPTERQAALALSRGLATGLEAIRRGERSAAGLAAVVASTIEAEPLAELDYVAVVDGHDLQAVNAIADGRLLLVAVAATVGRPRLIDNCTFEISTTGSVATDLAW